MHVTAVLLLEPAVLLLELAAMASGPPPHAPKRRFARDGRPYTRNEFRKWYGDAGKRLWASAPAPRASVSSCGFLTRGAAQLPVRELADAPQVADGRTGDAPQLADERTDGPGPHLVQSPDAAVSSAATVTKHAAQLPVRELAGAAPPADGRTDGPGLQLAQSPDAAVSSVGTITRDAAQLPVARDSLIARLMPEHVIPIQQEEAARGPPTVTALSPPAAS